MLAGDSDSSNSASKIRTGLVTSPVRILEAESGGKSQCDSQRSARKYTVKPQPEKVTDKPLMHTN